MKINGKSYPLWSQFVERKSEWVGGILQDKGDNMDRTLGLTNGGWISTKITDISLKPNGKDSAMFEVEGRDFSCGFDTQYGGISAGENGWITFNGYGGHEWRIKKETP